MILPVALIAAAACAVAPSARPAPGWAGEWRLDRAASTLRGDVIDIRSVATGYRFDIGAVRFTLADDGRFHATVAGRETRLAPEGPGHWLREHRVNGTVVDHSDLLVSPDGATLTIRDAGAGDRPAELLRREGGGSGLAGRWRSTRLGATADDVLSLGIEGGGCLRRGSAAEGNYYVVPTGGRATVNEGPSATASATMQVARTAGGQLLWTERVTGRPYRISADRLSADGGTITETTWPASDPRERQVLVYRRTAG